MTIKTTDGKLYTNVRTVAFDEEHLIGKGNAVLYLGDEEKVIKKNKIKLITQV